MSSSAPPHAAHSSSDDAVAAPAAPPALDAHAVRHAVPPSAPPAPHSTASTASRASSHPPLENLVFEGGGMKGLAFAGAVFVLSRAGLLSACKRYAGASAGAISALFLALGYTVAELADVFGRNWDALVTERFGVMSEAATLMSQWGMHDGVPFLDFLRDAVRSKLGNPDATFADLHAQRGVVLVVTGSCVNRRSVRFFHKDSTPDMSIALAVRISMSIPLFFAPVRIGSDLYVDGGLLDNFPLWIFDAPKLPEWRGEHSFSRPNRRTLGLKLLSTAESDEQRTGVYPDCPVGSFTEFGFAMVDGMLEQMDRLHRKRGDIDRIVTIPVYEVSSTNFALTPTDKMALALWGANAALGFLVEHGYMSARDATAFDLKELRDLFPGVDVVVPAPLWADAAAAAPASPTAPSPPATDDAAASSSSAPPAAPDARGSYCAIM